MKNNVLLSLFIVLVFIFGLIMYGGNLATGSYLYNNEDRSVMIGAEARSSWLNEDGEAVTEWQEERIENGLTTHLHVIVKRDSTGQIIERYEDGWEEGTADDGHDYYREIRNTTTFTYDSLNRVTESVTESWDSDTNTTTYTTTYKEYNDEEHPTHPSSLRMETEDANGNITTTERTNIVYENGQMKSWHETMTSDKDNITSEKDVTVEYNEIGQIVTRYEEGWEEGVDDDGNDYYREFTRTINMTYDNLNRIATQNIESWDSESGTTTNITKTYKYENEDHPSLASEIYTEMCTQGKCGWQRKYNIGYVNGEEDSWDEDSGGDIKFS